MTADPWLIRQLNEFTADTLRQAERMAPGVRRTADESIRGEGQAVTGIATKPRGVTTDNGADNV